MPGCPSPPRPATGCAAPARSRNACHRRWAGWHPVHGVDARHGGLHPDRPEAEIEVGPDGVEQLRQIPPGGVTVRHDAGAGRAAEQLVERHPGGLCLDVPERDVDRRDGRHGDRPAPPVRRAVQELPGVLDAVGVAPEQQRHHVVAQVRGDGEFASVQRAVAEAGEAVLSGDLQGDEVAVRAGDDDVGGHDLHEGCLSRGPSTRRRHRRRVGGNPRWARRCTGPRC